MLRFIEIRQAVFIASVMSIVVLWSQTASALEKVALQLKWVHQFQFAGYYAAKHK